ncbi:L-serine ammonia-lyase, iron-sulfur-dependent subunit beta [Paenibacillus cymbidii]|uniref:L-serine ammonia-lyase, iron-sulfur-dependent subunit beta n=1 Tax=Paenibacillus cymbidii TaxID=1639034 RepID=UPI0010807707|nr:L-serine ammonia-lyase, iron-sulfur-dependent subunit beta [Paenibacillus cymbidii]
MRFKDVFSIIGPAMIGPSSSHTAGAARIGLVARQLLGGITAERARITFYGSFAETYRGHGTDLAIVGGLLGYATDDPRIPNALEEAEAAGMDVIFAEAVNPVYHPNTAKLQLEGGDRSVVVIGSSIGGGNVEIVSVDEFDLKFGGSYPTLIIDHRDRTGLIADVTEQLRREAANIVSMDVDRKGRNGEAMTVIELDAPLPEACLRALAGIDGVAGVRTVDLT